MGIPNLFLFTQSCIYLLLFILSFFICIPAGLNLSDFSGHCLLYASGAWLKEERGGRSQLVNVSWGSDSACNFTIFIGVISLFVGLFYVIWMSVMLFKNIESSWFEAFVNLVVNSIMCICFFSTALTVSVGFREWCNLITDPLSDIENCQQGQYIPIYSYLNVDFRNYYTQWQIAQFGVWSSWILWLILVVMSLIRMYKYHRQEAFMISVNRERQRLLAQTGHHSEPT